MPALGSSCGKELMYLHVHMHSSPKVTCFLFYLDGASSFSHKWKAKLCLPVGCWCLLRAMECEWHWSWKITTGAATSPLDTLLVPKYGNQRCTLKFCVLPKKELGKEKWCSPSLSVFFLKDNITSAIRLNAMDSLQIPEESIQSDVKNVNSLEHRETVVTPDILNFLCIKKSSCFRR